MSCFAGFVGGIAGTPADIMNVRMQNDAAAPPEKRRNYKHAIDGIIRTAKSEGVAALWKGWLPNSTRAMLMTAGQLASYDTFKSLLLQNTGMKDNLTTHFTASVMAGFVATTIASPVDVIKTRIMSATESVGIITLIKETTKKEGLFWMYRGFVPSFMRLGPQTIFTFVFLEQHKKVYRHLKGTES
jgi:dicarboxylate transporter 10